MRPQHHGDITMISVHMGENTSFNVLLIIHVQYSIYTWKLPDKLRYRTPGRGSIIYMYNIFMYVLEVPASPGILEGT